jgi:predicted SnoaL-like aldol condensation-catalyzing enzyme
MSEADKELAKLWFEEVWNKGRREAIRELLAPDAVLYEGGVAVKGPEGFYPFFDRMRAAFSNIHVSVHEAIAEGDVVCVFDGPA